MASRMFILLGKDTGTSHKNMFVHSQANIYLEGKSKIDFFNWVMKEGFPCLKEHMVSQIERW
jgi:hypothetical protein